MQVNRNTNISNLYDEKSETKNKKLKTKNSLIKKDCKENQNMLNTVIKRSLSSSKKTKKDLRDSNFQQSISTPKYLENNPLSINKTLPTTKTKSKSRYNFLSIETGKNKKNEKPIKTTFIKEEKKGNVYRKKNHMNSHIGFDANIQARHFSPQNFSHNIENNLPSINKRPLTVKASSKLKRSFLTNELKVSKKKVKPLRINSSKKRNVYLKKNRINSLMRFNTNIQAKHFFSQNPSSNRENSPSKFLQAQQKGAFYQKNVSTSPPISPYGSVKRNYTSSNYEKVPSNNSFDQTTHYSYQIFPDNPYSAYCHNTLQRTDTEMPNYVESLETKLKHKDKIMKTKLRNKDQVIELVEQKVEVKDNIIKEKNKIIKENNARIRELEKQVIRLSSLQK